MLRGPAKTLAARIGQAEAGVVFCSVALVLGSVLWGVLTRYVSHQPAAWTGEVAGIAFCWCGFIGAAIIYAAGHPRIYDPSTIPSAVLRRAALGLGFVIQLVVLVAVLVLAIKQVGINFTNPTAVLRLPGSIYYVPMAWFSLSSLARLIFVRD